MKSPFASLLSMSLVVGVGLGAGAACGGGDSGGSPDGNMDGVPDGNDGGMDAPPPYMGDPLVGIGQVTEVPTPNPGMKFLEGPQWRRAEGDWVFTNIPAGIIYRYAPGGQVTPLVTPSGMANGLAVDGTGALLAAEHGGRRISRVNGTTLTPVAERFENKLFNSPNDVIVAADGTIYFTDASSHFGLGEYKMAVLEHAGDARLLSFKDGKVELIAGGLDFANGVALGPDDAYLVVTETSSYRIRRYWLTGEKKGQSEIFAENLPAFPDNITWSPSRKIFWVGCGSPRVKIVDLLAPYPFLRRMVGRLPAAVQPAPEKHQFVLGFDETGQIVHALQDPEGGYKPIASVLEHDGWLYLGSFSAKGVARVRAP